MNWKERYILGCMPMDDMHKEFIYRVNALAAASDSLALGALEDLFEHSERHFAQENLWMRESGFPPLQCHIDEHARVQASLQSIIQMVKKGNPGLGKIVAREMESWFDHHAATMDTALARHMRHVGYSSRHQQDS